jgi:hypothetical protein
MTFLNERWKKINKKQGETGTTNSKLFRMPNFRYLISNKTKDRSNTLNIPNTNTNGLIDKITSSTHRLGHHGRDRAISMLNEQKSNVPLSQITLEENVNKKEINIKSGEHIYIHQSLIELFMILYFSMFYRSY